jgi:hypothetical protein
MVCSDVIIEPIAARSTGMRATARPSARPTASAAAKPIKARRPVVASPRQSSAWDR